MARNKLRAVFYSRVSTEEEQQLNALESQIQENKDVIKEKGWELVGEYIDEGKTGTTTRKRTAYNRLLEDMASGKFDIIVAKDQDRLQRNTKDWYLFVDRLVSNDLDLFLYLDNKFFSPEDDALLTGIKAILAEEFSRNLSKKLNNYNRRRREKAKDGEKVVAIGNNKIIGYKIVDSHWTKVPEEIEFCLFVWDLYEKLDSLRKVRDELNRLGYKNTKGKPFSTESIRRILINEKAKGVIVIGKYHYDFNLKREVINPEEEWIRVPAPELAYVSEERWDKVNGRLKHKTHGGRGVANTNTPLSGKILCEKCGGVHWRILCRGYTYWKCSNNVTRGKIGCEGNHVSQLRIEKMYKKIAENVEVNKKAVKDSLESWLKSLRAELSVEVDTNTIEEEIKRLEGRRSKLTDAYLDEIIPKEDYAVKMAEIEEQLKAEKLKIQPTEENEDVKEIEKVLKNLDAEIDEYIKAEDFEKNKVDWLIEHTERIIANKKRFIVELDLLAGAIIVGEDFQLYVQGKAPYIVQNTVKGYSVEIRIVA